MYRNIFIEGRETVPRLPGGIYFDHGATGANRIGIPGATIFRVSTAGIRMRNNVSTFHVCSLICAIAASVGIISCSDVPVRPAGLTTEDTQLSGVAAPVLRTTLPASWDENWFASPAVYDLDNDGNMEIIAGRHSVLYVWKTDGTLHWRAPVGENASTSNDHGASRMYCSPVVGDLDGDGIIEIVVSLKDVLGGGKGGVQIWNVASAQKNNLDWPTGRGNYLRTGNFGGQ